MEGMRSLVVKAQAIDGINGIKFQFATIDEVGEGAKHGLAFQLIFVASAGGKTDQRRTPVAVNHDTEIESQPVRIPTVNFTLHRQDLASNFTKTWRSESMPAAQVSGNRWTRKDPLRLQDSDDAACEMAYNLSKAIQAGVHSGLRNSKLPKFMQEQFLCRPLPRPN
jgi:hypothetical protein